MLRDTFSPHLLEEHDNERRRIALMVPSLSRNGENRFLLGESKEHQQQQQRQQLLRQDTMTPVNQIYGAFFNSTTNAALPTATAKSEATTTRCCSTMLSTLSAPSHSPGSSTISTNRALLSTDNDLESFVGCVPQVVFDEMMYSEHTSSDDVDYLPTMLCMKGTGGEGVELLTIPSLIKPDEKLLEGKDDNGICTAHKQSTSTLGSSVSSLHECGGCDDGGGTFPGGGGHEGQPSNPWPIAISSVTSYGIINTQIPMITRRFIHPKAVLSFVLWCASYMGMGYFGGSVAYMHFPRTSSPHPEPLPDFGYDIIPQWCPLFKIGPSHSRDNIQSICLLILYLIILIGVFVKDNGRLVFQQLLHLNVLIFLTRTTTVGVTGFPQPNPRCVDHQHFPVTYREAVQFVIGRGFPPHACGDLVYSGHVACTLVCMVILHRHNYLQNWVQTFLVWKIATVGFYFVVSCRSHYTVDVVLAFYFTYFLQEFYYLRSDGVVRDRVGKVIRWLEDKKNHDGNINEVKNEDCIGESNALHKIHNAT